LEIGDQAAAISSLPTPAETGLRDQTAVRSERDEDPPKTLVAVPVAGNPGISCRSLTMFDREQVVDPSKCSTRNLLEHSNLGTESRCLALIGKVHPTGFEPVTFGSVGESSAMKSRSLIDS
jgi:hypothetical protein